jgi:hypothetical protein
VLPHDQAFAIAKTRQADFEADAAAERLARKPEETEQKAERPRRKLFARPRFA